MKGGIYVSYTFSVLLFLLFLLLFISGGFIYSYIKSPFHIFRFDIKIDISGRKKISYNNALDEWINEHTNLDSEIAQSINAWTDSCENILENTKFKKRRTKQYEKILNEYPIDRSKVINVYYMRNQTRYIQRNYHKTSYKVQNIDCKKSYTIFEITNRYNLLKDINFTTTLEKYSNNNQRKLMTKELKDRVKTRNNYTCQICGKYMPDEVGLHIDHIIPIKAGGKSIYENLQVLCSKCNGSKSSK